MFKKELGVIEDAKLYIEDHSCLTLDVFISLNNGGHICFGGWSLGHRNEPYIRKNSNDEPTNYAGYYIAKVLKVAGTDALNDVVAKPILVIFDNDKCVGIENIETHESFIPDRKLASLYDTENKSN